MARVDAMLRRLAPTHEAQPPVRAISRRPLRSVAISLLAAVAISLIALPAYGEHAFAETIEILAPLGGGDGVSRRVYRPLAAPGVAPAAGGARGGRDRAAGRRSRRCG